MSILSKIFGEERRINTLKDRVKEINALESEIEKLEGQALLLESQRLRESIQNGTQPLDAALPRAFALVREAARRTLGQRHYDVQLMGGMVMHSRGIAEMRTGEGKTLASTAPIYLNALEGKGTHAITVNDYLAKRDAVWMGQIYHALGLTVACISHDSAYRYDPDYVMEVKPLGVSAETAADKERDTVGAFRIEHQYLRPVSRKDAYLADVTYGTNHEFGFDYLRDNMVYGFANQVQRGHPFAIIDEVDSVLIDEAKTPLIIAAPDVASSDLYKTFARLARTLHRDTDYEVDEKFKSISITDAGIERVEKALNIENIYGPEHFKLVHYLEESLRAEALYKRDKDYVVKDNEVIIVDAFTGRMLHGRRYSGGLHQAIEAKEGVRVKEETKTVASITIQNYFRLYKKLAGMTGTAATSAEEFHKVYSLEVVTIPTNREMVRADNPDLVYKTEKAKYDALTADVKARHEKGQPVLIGTVAIERNEVVSTFLRHAGIPHEILNAKNHEREGEIIAQAGRKGAVTVATNMAGRGVDIVLGGNPPDKTAGDEIKAVGGLHVIGTERHESRRIDNQLRGRAGRQGDPGSSQFYLSLEDDLMRVFGGDRLKNLMNTLKVPDDMPIESGIVSKSIEQAQSRIEGFNFDAREHTLEYDDVLNKQRKAVYERRDRILRASEEGTLKEIAREIVAKQAARLAPLPAGEVKKILVNAGIIASESELDFEIEDENPHREQFGEHIRYLCEQRLDEALTPEKMPFLRIPMLQMIDGLWMNHLENIDALRDSVRIRAYAQHDPLVEFKREAHLLFKNLFEQFENLVFSALFRFSVTPGMKQVELQQDILKNAKTVHAGAAEKSGGGRSVSANAKVGRNDPCPCGSGKKYKKCHGR